MILGPVTVGCRERLTAHYGGQVVPWLDRAPSVVCQVAEGWELEVGAYHDAGHASVLATATTADGVPVILKAWFDRDRFEHETAALRHWEPINGRVILAHDDAAAVACLELIGGAPAGADRPADGDERVAAALTTLHQHAPPDRPFPDLDAYLTTEVEPRIKERAHRFGGDVPAHLVRLGLSALGHQEGTGRRVLLHADLYQENVLFTQHGVPAFVDPLPMIGDAAFDWAFFVVYHDLYRGPVTRLRLASRAGGLPVDVLLSWCLMLGLDGLLYYRDVGDGREHQMAGVMASLAAEGGQM